MRKRMILVTLLLFTVVISSTCLWWFQPWVSYLRDEPYKYPTGVIKEEDGKKYGWSKDCDVFTPEYMTGALDYPSGRADWSSGIIWVDGRSYAELCSVNDFLENGFSIESEEENEFGKEVILTKGDIELELVVNKFGHIYNLKSSNPSVTLVNGLDNGLSRWLIKRKLGKPSDYARYSKNSIQYMYYEDLVKFQLLYNINFADNEYLVDYTWFRVQNEVDEDNDGVPDPLLEPAPAINFDYVDDHSDWVIPDKTEE